MSEISEHREHRARHERNESGSPGEFRSQQRFSDPSAPASPPPSPVPPEWTALTPPHGIPVVEPPVAEQLAAAQPDAEPQSATEVPAAAEETPVADEAPPAATAPFGQPSAEEPPQDEPTVFIDPSFVPSPVHHQLRREPALFTHQADLFTHHAPEAPVYHQRPSEALPPVVQQAPLPPYAAAPQPPHLDLSTVALLGRPKQAPSAGWRKWLYLASVKKINVGESPKINRRNALQAQVRQPLHGCYRIALLSLKGGVGKTTITATLGATIASTRGDRVVAVDANPDRGTLSQKVPLETTATVRDLLRDADKIHRYSDVRAYTSQGPSRLEVLASETDPAVSEAFSSEDYLRTLDLLERFYSLVLTDCGTGLMHSAMSAVLDKADALIVISSGSVDGARSASATLDWLDAHGHEDLVRSSIAVINAVRPQSGKVDMQKVVDHFSRRSRMVLQVPFDPHLEEGAEISLERLKPPTREALIELAAVVADGFAGTRRMANPPV